MNSVLWSAPLRQSGEWVTPSVAVFIPESQKLKSIIERSLANCGVKLVDVPLMYGVLSSSLSLE